METSQGDLFINMVVDRFIFKNNQSTLSCFTFIPRTSVGLPKTGVSFCCVGAKIGEHRMVARVVFLRKSGVTESGNSALLFSSCSPFRRIFLKPLCGRKLVSILLCYKLGGNMCPLTSHLTGVSER